MQDASEQTDLGAFGELGLSRDWVAIGLRVLPVGLLALIGALFLVSRDGDDVEEVTSVETELTAAVAGSDAAPALPPISYDRSRPELFVQGTVGDGSFDPDEATTSTEAATTTSSSGSSGSNSTSTTGQGSPNEQDRVDRGSANQATTTTAGATTTSRRSTTTGNGSSSSSATTARPTTASTARPTTAAPTTARPTTAAPTTAAPTTARPTTAPPTTAAPTTAAPTTSGGGTCASNGEFERIFRDDFNGSSVGGSWFQYNSTGNSNYGLRRPSANSVANGKLTITAKMENGSLVSGGMSHNVDQKYGKWVVKVRTDNDPSQAVSGVVLTWPQSGVHPRDGENNIYETLVKTPNRNPFFTFIHKPFGSKSDQEHYKHTADGSQFQTMTMEWTPSRITIIREGPGGAAYRDVWTVNETSADLIPDVAHHLAIQLDGWKHTIGGPVRMEVDFVEVYKYCG